MHIVASSSDSDGEGRVSRGRPDRESRATSRQAQPSQSPSPRFRTMSAKRVSDSSGSYPTEPPLGAPPPPNANHANEQKLVRTGTEDSNKGLM